MIQRSFCDKSNINIYIYIYTYIYIYIYIYTHTHTILPFLPLTWHVWETWKISFLKQLGAREVMEQVKKDMEADPKLRKDFEQAQRKPGGASAAAPIFGSNLLDEGVRMMFLLFFFSGNTLHQGG